MNAPSVAITDETLSICLARSARRLYFAAALVGLVAAAACATIIGGSPLRLVAIGIGVAPMAVGLAVTGASAIAARHLRRARDVMSWYLWRIAGPVDAQVRAGRLDAASEAAQAAAVSQFDRARLEAVLALAAGQEPVLADIEGLDGAPDSGEAHAVLLILQSLDAIRRGSEDWVAKLDDAHPLVISRLPPHAREALRRRTIRMFGAFLALTAVLSGALLIVGLSLTSADSPVGPPVALVGGAEYHGAAVVNGVARNPAADSKDADTRAVAVLVGLLPSLHPYGGPGFDTNALPQWVWVPQVPVPSAPSDAPSNSIDRLVLYLGAYFNGGPTAVGILYTGSNVEHIYAVDADTMSTLAGIVYP